MSETPAEMIKALEDRISGRIKELHDELKHHCDISDARMRDNEHDIIENNVLLEQFVDMQQRQNETTEKLNNTLTSLNGSIGTMEKSIKELFKRTGTSRWFIEHPAQQVTDAEALEEIMDWVDGETLAEYDPALTPVEE